MNDRSKTEIPLQNALSNAAPETPDLERVYRDHHRQVLRTAYRVTGSSHDAEDVVQTVFLRLARREGGSPLSDSPGNYLHRAAINAALDIVRSRQAARTTSFEPHEATLTTDPEEGPVARQRTSELKAEIKKALARMSPKSAEIFILRYFEGYGNHEIAKMLGTSRSTVNVILHRTRQRLKEDIRDYVGDRS